MNETTKRYLISSAITFLSTFLVVLGSQLGDVSQDTFSNGALLGIIITAGRAGVKVLAEKLITK